MKQLFARPTGRFVILATLVFSQFVFGDELIKKGGDPTQPTIQSSSCTVMESDLYVNDITIDIIGTDLIISFNSPIGIATVSISDVNGYVAYQSTVDTNSTSEVVVPISLLGEGIFTVTVTYGTTVYSEQIQL
jgi:hypothetical protein